MGDYSMKILITGGSSGIGFDTAVRLALSKNKHHIYLAVHKSVQVRPTKEKIKMYNLSNIEVIVIDITKSEDLLKVKDLDIDCLVNNAAIGVGGSLLHLDVSEIRKNFEVNFFATLELTKEVMKSFVNSKKSGTIVTMSSLAGLIPIPFLGSYSSTKAALLTMMTALRRELLLLKVPIKIKLIEPGLYKTGFNDVMLDSAKGLCNLSDLASRYDSIIEFEQSVFNLLELTYTDSIVKKIVKAVESKNNHFIYRNPLLQVFGAKMYMLLFK